MKLENMWKTVFKHATSEHQYKCDSIQFNKHFMSMQFMQSSKLVLKGNTNYIL